MDGMDFVEKYQTVFVLVAILGGIALGQVSGIPPIADQLILPFLMVMLFAAFTGIPLSRLRTAFGNRRVVGSSLLINFIWSPLLAVGLGAIFLRDHPALWVGLIMLMVTPCTDWYLIFTDIADGDVPLATSILPYNLVLQLILLPFYLYIFAGELVALPLELLIESVVLVLVVPLIIGGIARWGLTRRKGQRWFTQQFLPKLSPFQIIFLSLAIGAMFASQGEVILDNPGLLALLAVPVIVFYAINLGIGFGVGQVLSF
jgi:ACR3 family arsenite efflux pump ArsB